MAVYNRMKSASRACEITDRKAELGAIEAGTWPRSLDDDMRWGSQRYFRDMAEKAAYVRPLLEAEITYLEGIPSRIKAGELPGWEL